MADNLRLAISRVYRTGASKGITYTKHAMLWLFQVFALTAGLYGCQVWATFSLTYDSSVTTRAHVLHLGFLKKLLGVKKIFFFWWGLLHGPQQGPDRMKEKKPKRLGKGKLLPKQKNPP